MARKTITKTAAETASTAPAKPDRNGQQKPANPSTRRSAAPSSPGAPPRADILASTTGRTAEQLLREFRREGTKKDSGGLTLHYSPKKLMATPIAREIAAAPVSVQIELLQIAAENLAAGPARSSPLTDILINLLLRRSLPVPSPLLVDLLTGIPVGRAHQVSKPVLVGFLEKWWTRNTPDERLRQAVTSYHDSLHETYHRKERQRLGDLLKTTPAALPAKKPTVHPPLTTAPTRTLSSDTIDQWMRDVIASIPSGSYMPSQLRNVGKIKQAAALPASDLAAIVERLVQRKAETRKQALEARAAGPEPSPAWNPEAGAGLWPLIQRLMARQLPLSPEAIAMLCRLLVSDSGRVWMLDPVAVTVKAVEHAASDGRLTSEALAAVENLRAALILTSEAGSARLADRLRAAVELAGPTQTWQAPEAAASSALLASVLRPEKLDPGPEPWLIDMLLAGMTTPPETDSEGAVSFALDSIAGGAAALLFLNEFLRSSPNVYVGYPANEAPELMDEFGDSAAEGAALLMSAAAAMTQRPVPYTFTETRSQRFHNGLLSFMRTLPALVERAAQARELSAQDLIEICHSLSRFKEADYVGCNWHPLAQTIAAAAAPLLQPPAAPSDRLLLALVRFRERLARTQYARGAVSTFDAALGMGDAFPTDLGERWSDRAYTDIASLPPQNRAAWLAVLEHCSMAASSNPTEKWLKKAGELLASIPPQQVQANLTTWFPLVGKPRPALPGGKIEGRDSSVPSDRAADLLRGLAWIAARFDSPQMARALGDLAMACYKMVPGVGARCIKPGTSAVWALSQMASPEALGQLSRIRQLVKFGTAKKVLDTSLSKLARQLNMTTDELHEVSVPDFGLAADGTITEEAGDFTLQLRLIGSDAEVRILDEEGRERKSVPDSVKRHHGPALKALKQTAADIDKMLAAQKDRLERLYHDQRTWPAAAWRTRYLDHPLVGALARRLIWSFTRNGRTTEAIAAPDSSPEKHAFIDARGKSVETRDDDTVTLWHPVTADPSQVQAWRGHLEERAASGDPAARQPFKQAHREIYILTDAERNTRTYSNRFAAHIIRQAQLVALCQARGWSHKLFLLEYGEPPLLHIPRHNLYAQFLVEGIGDDHYGSAGAFTYLQTDQVRFTRTPLLREGMGGDPRGNIPLEEVPPLIFSEVMRDVDLFVAITSVGNNPQWQDGGPDGFARDYWWTYSFGDLAESGKSRRDTLARLLPRLKIASVCDLQDRFLHVRGKLRTYKIHLGSGNILMDPNDEYLCIVPGSIHDVAETPADSSPTRSGRVFLPFEGDRTLSIILSKAFMLAEDDQIKDPSIVRQIRRA